MISVLRKIKTKKEVVMENVVENKIIKVGDKIEEFEFETYDPKKRAFSNFSLKRDSLSSKKWTVLVYYPADFTFVCPTELKDLQDNYKELSEMGVNVVSVSTDTKFVHLAWRESEKLLKDVLYPMASDVSGVLAKRFAILDEKSGLAYRATIIINPDGVVSGIEVNLNNVGRNFSELVRKMKAFIHTYSNPSEVCPAKWEPGKKTLKPSEKIVGKVYEQLES